MGTEVQEAIAASAPPASTEPAPAPTPTPAEPSAPAADLDPDAAALAAIKAEAADPSKTAPPAPDTPAPAAAATPAAPAPAAPPSARMVPAAALLAERRRAQESERQAAELSGQVAVLQRLVPAAAEPAAPTGEPADAPIDRVAQIDAEIIAIAEKFDRGDITMVEQKKAELALMRERDQLIEQRSQQAAVRSDTTLAEHSRQLMEKYPAAATLTEAQIAALTDMAHAEAVLEGKPIGVGVEATKDLRTRIAVLAQAKFGQPVPTGAPASPATPTLSRNAQANARAIDNAAAAPPDVSRIGTATTAVMPSDDEVMSKLEHMSDDEANAYLNSMPGLRARIRGM